MQKERKKAQANPSLQRPADHCPKEAGRRGKPRKTKKARETQGPFKGASSTKIDKMICGSVGEKQRRETKMGQVVSVCQAKI